MNNILVIGVGNALRQDDAAGLAVIGRLRGRIPANVTLLEHDGEGALLIEAWRDAGHVIVIDAVSSGAKPGTIHRFDASRQPLPADLASPSTHTFGLAQAVEMARALDRLPDKLVVYGIEGDSFAMGSGMTPTVDEAVQLTAESIFAELQAWLNLPAAP